MTVILDVAIGLAFVYIVLSLLGSAVAESIEHFYRYRAEYLRLGIQKLLLKAETKTEVDLKLHEKLYKHPLIASLHSPSVWEGLWTKIARAGGPTYIPTGQFVLALLDVAAEPADPKKAQPPSSVAELRTAIETNYNAGRIPKHLAGALQTLMADAGGDMEKVKANVGEWFDGSMDRVAGWYKRRAQFVLLIIGIVVAVIVNADTLTIVQTLSNDAAVRAAVVAAAEAQAREGLPAAPPTNSSPATPDEALKKLQANVTGVVSQLDALGLPVGWRWRYLGPDDVAEMTRLGLDERRYMVQQRVWPYWQNSVMRWLGDWWAQLASHLLGWLLTAIAVSFGAPFWFDLLNKIMVIRSTVKPREKSREEGSEDRQPPGAATQTVRVEIAPAK